jgi:large subunit ribosomal protein L9
MEVILLQDVDQIGKAGERVKVRDGFSRNFLIPKKLAVAATEGGLRFMEAKKKRAEAKRVEEAEVAKKLGEQIQQLTCVIKAKVGPEGKLFGAITRQDIHTALLKEKIDIDKRKVELAELIHQAGEYQIPVRVYTDIVVPLRVIVTEA